MIKGKRKVQIENLIKDLFYENSVEFDEAKLAANVKILDSRQILTSKDLAPSEVIHYYTFLLADGSTTSGHLLDLIGQEKIVPKGSVYETFHFIVFVPTFQKKRELEQRTMDIRIAMQKITGGYRGECFYQVLQMMDIKDGRFPIGIDCREDMIRMPSWGTGPDESGGKKTLLQTATGYVTTASLFDLVEMYNQIGDSLFAKNLRYKVNERLGVEQSIDMTLKKTPEEFWYLNNGITMMITKKENLDLSGTSVIGVRCTDAMEVSVINGAQTISTAADFLYSLKDVTEAEKRNAKERAKVLLRINVMNESRDYREGKDRISIALNRQKPISIEDISYTNEVISKINQLYEENREKKEFFYLLKRGEKVSKNPQYMLKDFGKIVRACVLQEPGSARSLSVNEILKEDENNRIYAEEMADSSQPAEVFEKYYRPVNFAMRLSAFYIRQMKKIDGKNQQIVSNGRYYFVAYIVWILNGEKPGTDFSDFPVLDGVVPESFHGFLEKYLEVVEAVIHEYFGRMKQPDYQVSSNTFKNDRLYQELREYEETGADDLLKEEIREFKKSVRSYFEVEESGLQC